MDQRPSGESSTSRTNLPAFPRVALTDAPDDRKKNAGRGDSTGIFIVRDSMSTSGLLMRRLPSLQSGVGKKWRRPLSITWPFISKQRTIACEYGTRYRRKEKTKRRRRLAKEPLMCHITAYLPSYAANTSLASIHPAVRRHLLLMPSSPSLPSRPAVIRCYFGSVSKFDPNAISQCSR